MVEEIAKTGEGAVRLTVKDLGEMKVRLDELLPLLFGCPAADLGITRMSMYGWDGAWKEPMEDEPSWAARS
jgi:hypothetical protein